MTKDRYEVGIAEEGRAAERRRRRPRGAAIGQAAIAVLWLGLLLGVSFLATPAKFFAPSLSLAVALDVGRQTFGLFNPVEIGLWLAVLTAILAGRPRWPIVALVAVLGVLLALQTLWLLPALDARVETILRGGTPPASMLHVAYIAVDALKALLLVVCGVAGFRRVAAA